MFRPNLEVADIFRRHGEAWRTANEGHVNLAQRRVMTAIEICRTAALGGHVEHCPDCEHTRVAYNSCRNRHCPKCQSRAAAAWLAKRQAEVLPVPYFHFVFALPAMIGAMAYQNKAKLYGLLFKAASETLITIAADRKHLGADIGVMAVLHTWGQNLQHHPHVHCVVPGGGISLDGKHWIACRPGFFLPVRVLSRLFRRLFLEGLMAAFEAGELQFFADLAYLNQAKAFAAALTALRTVEWAVYAKRTFAGPEQLLAYLARYTHRVAITNNRLLELDESHVTFRWKKARQGGGHKRKVMCIQTCRVRAPLPPPRPTEWLSSHSSLWSLGERPSCQQARIMPKLARSACSAGGSSERPWRRFTQPKISSTPVRMLRRPREDCRDL